MEREPMSKFCRHTSAVDCNYRARKHVVFVPLLSLTCLPCLEGPRFTFLSPALRCVSNKENCEFVCSHFSFRIFKL